MKKKHKITLLVIGILLTLSLIIGASYAYYIFSVSQSGSNVVRTDCFEITYTDGNAISLSDAIPLTDKEAKDLTPYHFTIKNICNNVMEYNVNIETLNTSTMNLNSVAAKLDGKKKQVLGTLDNNTNIINNNASSSKTIYSAILKAGEEKTHNLRLWVDENATIEQSMNKSFSSKVVINGTLKPNYSEGTLKESLSQIFMSLSGQENVNATSVNDTIKSIQRSNTKPSDNITYEIISKSPSDYPIYAWFDNGIIYIYTQNEKVFLPNDCTFIFRNLNGLENIDLSLFDTSKVTNMYSMFSGASNLTSLDVSNFDTSRVTNMTSMFNGASNLTSIDVSNFDTSNVTDISWMFSNMRNLKSINLSNFDTTNVINMSGIFSNSTNLTYLNVQNFDTSKVTNMSRMFYNLSGIESLDLSNFDTSNVTDMSYMFSGMSSLKNLNISSFNTSKITNMAGMFSMLTSINNINIQNFDTSNVTDMNRMFYGTNNLTSIDLSSFDTSKVTNMEYMFISNNNLSTILVSDKWSTENVTNSDKMFNNCNKLTGGAGTTYSYSHITAEYARVDDPSNNQPGYFTLKNN